MDKEYVGDGVYIQQGHYRTQIVLTTENGVSIDNTIYLDLNMIGFINKYVDKLIDKYKEDKDGS